MTSPARTASHEPPGGPPRIPFLDLAAQHASLKREIDHAIQDVIARSAFIGGEYVAAFQQAFAAYCGVARGVGTSSGTTALHLALAALGIGPGDEVITVTNTFTATAETIVQTGATPVFVDVREDTLNIDVDAVASAITERTRAIVPVHLYGQIADVAPLAALAEKHEVAIVEDAAQAHGAEYHGRRAGQFGNSATFSFFPGKILGALGDAGMVVTSDEALADRMERLANHGRCDKYRHAEAGYNYRLDGLQAAVLQVKLGRLEEWIEKRKEKARLYERLLSDTTVRTPVEDDGRRHVYTYYVVRTPERDRLQEELTRAGVDTLIHYPVPLHLQPAYESLGYGLGDFPVAERAAGEILSLPLYPELPDASIERIVGVIRATVA